jgi:hypothetical protein
MPDRATRDRRGLRLIRPDDEPPPPTQVGGWPPFVEQWLLPYLREPSLWPVALAVLGHVVVVLVPLMLAVARVGSTGAGVALAGMGLASLAPMRWEWVSERGFGRATVTIVLVWCSSAAVAWAAGRSGLL